MKIHLAHDDCWIQRGDVAVAGSAFIDTQYLSREALAQRIASTDGTAELKQLLAQLNGFFSIIYDRGEEVDVAVDHVRSWPLYYAVSDDIYISDSAEWVHEHGSSRGYDPVAGMEYLFTGFVSGRETLSRDVKQLRAGELVTLFTAPSDARVHSERYFSYDPSETAASSSEPDFETALTAAVKRLIEYADGRTILLGLSSGHDSRLIALMLHELGYDDTIAYTSEISDPDSAEIPVAKAIARDLGFEHIELRSGDAEYQRLEGSEHMDLIEDVGYLSEYPNINRIVQKRKLEEAGIDPAETVNVLGHGMHAGTFLSEQLRTDELLPRDDFLESIWNLHYSFWELPDDPRWRRLFEGRILDRTPTTLYRSGTVEPVVDAVSAFEQWYWQERLPKYLLFRREYEWLGFNMWYPLLDRTLLSFFQRTDYRERIGKRLMKRYTRQLDRDVRGTNLDLRTAETEPSLSPREMVWDQLVTLFHTLPDTATQPIREQYNKYHLSNMYGQDPRYNIVSREEFESIPFPKTYHPDLHRPLLLVALYNRGFFEFPVETAFDRAVGTT